MGFDPVLSVAAALIAVVLVALIGSIICSRAGKKNDR